MLYVPFELSVVLGLLATGIIGFNFAFFCQFSEYCVFSEKLKGTLKDYYSEILRGITRDYRIILPPLINFPPPPFYSNSTFINFWKIK